MNASGDQVREVCTARLCLRLPFPEDAAPLASLMGPDISARLASWPVHLAPEAAAARLGEARAAAMAGLALPMVITRRDGGEIVGWISAARSEADRNRAVLTYWLGDRFQGEGLMREAAPAALAAIFGQLGVSEVRAAVQPDNTASRAVLRGLGMRPLGVGRIWCAARGREEQCEWWTVLRPIESILPQTDVAEARLPSPAGPALAR
ncbi:GNAT family N-acetyltransferase [Roseomonas frigidaquae]|uniref:GNAT family N-acetyltransferase n=1 Tax=Falsiroseomonas frigidaquae TaxID=487318 RepID=A0ABX1EYC6_9PROT|nr:GNAT family N-acetyltransferase [Falsiroseomonas frigidaquae]NKE45044.1 GNAT family N-acetyltransferase [Falsiroseomonas frigidaquae]